MIKFGQYLTQNTIALAVSQTMYLIYIYKLANSPFIIHYSQMVSVESSSIMTTHIVTPAYSGVL